MCAHTMDNGLQTQNMFDNLPALAAPKTTRDEVSRYLNTDPEQVQDVLQWWLERKSMFPCLSRMALDYLTIPGESHQAIDRVPEN